VIIGKMDVKSAFRLLPVSPTDFDLLGIKFQEKYFIDKCLPMGCSISCHIFETFSTFLHWLTVSLAQVDSMDHYLDDFIFAGRKNTNTCAHLMS
ncbi:hypothetical protein NL427_26935, partial [Klebsiella pneumoniae]|nr:hypothetical protein [Klebsiella pneumoniae]